MELEGPRRNVILQGNKYISLVVVVFNAEQCRCSHFVCLGGVSEVACSSHKVAYSTVGLLDVLHGVVMTTEVPEGKTLSYMLP